MLDRDLAEMYGVETKRLNEQVKRNEIRFPPDFMFQLTEQELENWKSQFVTLKKSHNSDKYYSLGELRWFRVTSG